MFSFTQVQGMLTTALKIMWRVYEDEKYNQYLAVLCFCVYHVNTHLLRLWGLPLGKIVDD